MSDPTQSVHPCACSRCTGEAETEIARYHYHINQVLSRLNELQRRWYVGSLSLAPDAPTDGELALITGLDEKTIRRGRRELQGELPSVPAERLRHEGGGQPAAEKKIQA